MSVRALVPILACVALTGCTQDVTEPTGAATSSDAPMTLACAAKGTPPAALESATMQRVGSDLILTWRADDVPPAPGSFSASIWNSDGTVEYMVSVELVEGELPSPSTGPNVVFAEPTRVASATYPLSAMPGIGSDFQWAAALTFRDGDGSFSQCPPGGAPATYPDAQSGA